MYATVNKNFSNMLIQIIRNPD